MKLLVVTVVEQFEADVLRLFKEAKIESFSESQVDGYKNSAPLLMTSSWFPSEKGGVKSSLFFSFTEEKKIEVIIGLIKAFNETLETNNPIKAVVVPIEQHI